MLPESIVLVLAIVAPQQTPTVEVRHDGVQPAGDAFELDFRYQPPWWQTSICLPDDPQKTIVGKEGELLDDYGGGPYRGFKTSVSVRPLGDGVPEAPVQRLLDPRIPIVETTWKLAGNRKLVTEAFAVVPKSMLLANQESTAPSAVKVVRLDDESGLDGWASPKGTRVEAFESIAVGWDRSIRYRLDTERATVGLGLCEGYWKEAGKRILDLRVEGSEARTIDTVKDIGHNVPGIFFFGGRDADGDGAIAVEVATNAQASDANTILNALWVLEYGAVVSKTAILGGRGPRARTFVNCGVDDGRDTPPRLDLIVIRSAGGAVDIEVTVASRNVRATKRPAVLSLGSRSGFAASRVPTARRPTNDARLWTFALPAGDALVLCLTNGLQPVVVIPAQAAIERQRAIEYWKAADLPYDAIDVPDPAVKGLIDSCIRNIYQAREIKKGLPAFQVGPTCYRGLWVVDGAFLLEAVSFLGRALEARAGIDTFLSYQQDDGRFELLHRYWKENGIILWVLDRHARLTGDDDWLRSKWKAVRAAVRFLIGLRREASKDPGALHYGLVPPGFTDGGIAGANPEYTNVYWNLLGLKAAIEAAQRLGETEDAVKWKAEYEDFLARFRKAAARDLVKVADSPPYLPVVMGEKRTEWNPQSGQWGFCHFIFPGKVLAADDPLIAGNLALLDRSMCEGQVRGTGWLRDGIWNYFGSFHAHALLWTGRARHAAAMLYAFGNHASPLLCWREEQSVQSAPKVAICGDMPHNWASAEFIRLVRHVLVLERESELHLLEGMPPTWAVPGTPLRLRGIVTEFGPLDLELAVKANGGGTLRWRGPTRRAPTRIVVHLGSWASGAGAVRASADGWSELPLRSERTR